MQCVWCSRWCCGLSQVKVIPNICQLKNRRLFLVYHWDCLLEPMATKRPIFQTLGLHITLALTQRGLHENMPLVSTSRTFFSWISCKSPTDINEWKSRIVRKLLWCMHFNPFWNTHRQTVIGSILWQSALIMALPCVPFKSKLEHWTDGWMGRSMDTWMNNGCMDGWMNIRWMDG